MTNKIEMNSNNEMQQRLHITVKTESFLINLHRKSADAQRHCQRGIFFPFPMGITGQYYKNLIHEKTLRAIFHGGVAVYQSLIHKHLFIFIN